jgi:3-deoxy-D-manno-octulosonic-acid transferase
MNPDWVIAGYRAASRVLQALPLSGKLGESLAGRRDGVARWRALRDRPAREKVVWLHAASVGEALAAQPVIERLRSALPAVEIIFTYSSPSLAAWPASLPADASGFVPPEDARAVAAVFDAIRPSLLLFSRSDTWPELLLAARKRGVPVSISGATVRPGSARLRWPVRTFLSALHRDIRFAGACTDDDALRWARLGVPERAIVVTGDPRHDQVLERVTDMGRLRSFLGWTAQGPTLVAGSAEDTDLGALLGAAARVQRTHAAARLLLVPHDPHPDVVAGIRRHASRAGVRMVSSADGGEAGCLVVTERGILADLYALGTGSYVGGGFNRSGLHAVIEPAVFGTPIVFGPEYRSSRDATALVAAGGAFPLPWRNPAQALSQHWLRWVEDGGKKNRAGIAARRTLHQGAAAVTARHLLALVG